MAALPDPGGSPNTVRAAHYQSDFSSLAARLDLRAGSR